MTRFKSTKLKSLLVLLSLVVSLTFKTLAQPRDTPNILIIMTDQQAWDAVGYSGNKMIKTPNLDRLAREGVNFSQAVTPCPVCVPARTSILTGRLTETTTIRENGDAKTGDCYYPTFDEILAKRGYKTEVHGKFHAPEHMARVYSNPPVEGMTGSEPIIKWEPIYVKYIRNTFDKRPLKPGELYETTFYGGTVPYRLDPPDRYYQYMPSGKIPEDELKQKLSQADIHGVLDLPAEYTITAFQAKQTIEAIERLKNVPFSITCSFHFPHAPMLPTEPYYSMYPASEMTPPASISDDMENSPYRRANGRLENPEYSDPEKIKYMISNYYGLVREIDDWVGRILEALDQNGLTDNTLVIFTSDHGEMLGAHGLREKNVFYEESAHVPLIIRFPGEIQSNRQVDGYVSNIDLFPTILDYLEVGDYKSDGTSLRDLIEGQDTKHGEYVVTEWDYRGDSESNYMIVKDGWKLIIPYSKESKVINAMYDLNSDPREMKNLIGKNPDRVDYFEKVEDLRSCLLEWLKKNNSKHYQGVKERKLI